MRRLLPAAGVVIALMAGAQTARATTPGLTATLYEINTVPPARDAGTYPQCGITTLPNVNIVWEYQPVEGCPLDGFMAHLTGYLTFPAHQTARLWVAGDDGVLMKVGLDEFGAWQDQGCSAYVSEPVTYPAGAPVPVDLWYYENGGSTCLMAAWSLDGGPWEIIPPEAFSTTAQEPTPPATTTTSSSTTTTSTTSTTSTTVPATSTTYQDSSSQTTTSQTSQAIPTTVQPSTTYQPATSSSAPSETAPTPTSSQNPATTSTTPATTILETPAIPSTIPTTIPTTSTPATVPPADLTPREALTVAMDPAKVAVLDFDTAAELFATIDEDGITPEIGAALVAAVQNAPTAVRAAFEQNLNVFAGATDEYVPLGSTVPVRTRRVIIITTGLIVAMPTATRRGRP